MQQGHQRLVAAELIRWLEEPHEGINADTLQKTIYIYAGRPHWGILHILPKKCRNGTMKHHKVSESEERTSASPVTGSALRPEQMSDDAPDKVHTP